MDVIEAGKLIKLYNEIGAETIDNLYLYSCLLTSGFKSKTAIKMIYTLKDMWLKDEACRCISELSDLLYNYYEEAGEDEILDLSTRELLVEVDL